MIDTATNTVVDTVAVGNFPIGVAVAPDGAFIYVTNFGSTHYRPHASGDDGSPTVSTADIATSAVPTDPLSGNRLYLQNTGPAGV